MVKMVIIIFLLFFAGCNYEKTYSQTSPAMKGQIVDEVDYKIFLPSTFNKKHKYPLVIALSPGANPDEMLNVWKYTGEKYEWIVMASKIHKNDMDYNIIFKILHSDIEKILSTYPVDKTRIIATGLSGGGMSSHALSFEYPDLISAVIINTGKMNDYYINEKDRYPKNKIAIFIASPTDFRYDEMKRDKAFLESLNWKTEWLEFEGGHTIAPVETYNSAAQKLKNLFWVRDEMKKI